MKTILVVSITLFLSSTLFGQIVISTSIDGKHGLLAHGSGTVIEPEHDTMIEIKGVLENYGVLGDDGVLTLYYDNPKNDTLEIINTAYFTDVQTYYPEDEEKAQLIIRDSLGNSWFMDVAGNWTGPNTPSGLYGACNSKYKYALFQNGQMLTDYLYYYIYQPQGYTHDYYEPFLYGQTDSGYIVIDTLGKTLYPFAIDRSWPATYADQAYVCARGDFWGVFSLNDKYYYPMTELQDGWSAFDIDDAAYTDLKGTFIAKKNGKWGRTSLNKVILPFENDRLYRGLPGKSYIRLKDNKWELIKNKKPKVIRELQIDDWYGVDLLQGKWYGVVKKDGRIVHINLKTGAERLDTESFFLIKELSLKARFTDDSKYVGYNDQGEIIVPYPNDFLRAMEEGDLKYFIVCRDDKWGVIDSEKKELLPLAYEHILVFYRVKNFFAIKKDGMYAMAGWDVETKSWDILTDFKFAEMFGSVSEGVAIGIVESGLEYTIYEDGSMKVKR